MEIPELPARKPRWRCPELCVGQFAFRGRLHVGFGDAASPVLEYELLRAAVIHNLAGVKITLRVCGHVMHDVELTHAISAHADHANLSHCRTIENDDAHRPRVDDVKELLLGVR